MAAVFGRYGTTPRSFGATFWNPGFKTEKTAKKREKTGQKWARYGLRKRVRVADLFLMDRYVVHCDVCKKERAPPSVDRAVVLPALP